VVGRQRRRRESRIDESHYDPVLQHRTHSSPAITLTRKDSDEMPFTYAQAVTLSSTLPSLSRRSVTTAPASEVQRGPPKAAVPATPRKQSLQHENFSTASIERNPLRLTMPVTPQRPVLKKQDTDVVSEAPSSVFDLEEAHSDTDSTTDISGSSFNDPELPPELDQDQRLINPHRYFEELEDLEGSVVKHSGLNIMLERNRQKYPTGRSFHLMFPFPKDEPDGFSSDYPDYDMGIVGFCKKTKNASPTKCTIKRVQDIHGRLQRADLAHLAFHVLETRNLLIAINANIARLNRAQYCNSSFNFLTLSKTRPEVAYLVSMSTASVKDLLERFETAIATLVPLVTLSPVEWPSAVARTVADITESCTKLLEQAKIEVPASYISKWRLLMLVLDLAVISYSGAHIERFDFRYLRNERNEAESLDPARLSASWTYLIDGSDGLLLRRRSLRCLRPFLADKPVWVFQSQSLWDDEGELWLSSTAEEIADIWGPMWAAKDDENSEEIQRYNVGSGILYAVKDSAQPKEAGEIPCHWAPSHAALTEETVTLTAGAKLLVGAEPDADKRKEGTLSLSGTTLTSPSVPEVRRTSQLKENEACQNSRQDVLRQLRSANLIEELGTSRAKNEASSTAYTAGVSGYGLAVGATKVYKVS
jgi:hypothetical protein